MGAICNGSTVSVNNEMDLDGNPIPTRQVTLQKYNSGHDNYYDKFEKAHNLLKYIELTEYSSIVSSIKFKNSKINEGFQGEVVDQKKNMFFEDLEKFDFKNFIISKILNHHLLYTIKDSDSSQIFTDFLIRLYDITGKGMVSFASEWRKRGKGKIGDKKVKKYFLLAIGILYCHSEDLSKVNIFFHSFANKNNELEMNVELNAFLFVMFLISSFGGMYGIYEMAKSYPKNVPNVTAEDYSKALEIYEASDMVEIGDLYIQELFKGSTSSKLKFDEYLERVTVGKLDWVFSGAGIRRALENKDTKSMG